MHPFGLIPSADTPARAVRSPGDPALTSHIPVAVVPTGLEIALVVVPGRGRAGAGPQGGRILGLLAVPGTSVAGTEFVLSGYFNNAGSVSMALAFSLATSFYGVARGRVLSSKRGPSPPASGRPGRTASSYSRSPRSRRRCTSRTWSADRWPSSQG